MNNHDMCVFEWVWRGGGGGCGERDTGVGREGGNSIELDAGWVRYLDNRCPPARG